MSTNSQLTLLSEKRFGPFFLSQLTGAFSDNLFKQILVLMVTYQSTKFSTLDPGLLVNMAAGLFILPFLLFSALAGQLADRYDKARLIQVIKGCEIGILSFATWGFYANSLEALMGALFLMGTHSAFFGPVKYSLLPHVLKEHELVGGNGLLESATFMAILAGTLCAGLIVGATSSPFLMGVALLSVAIVGFVSSLFVPKTGSSAPSLKVSWNLPLQTWEILKLAKKTPAVWLSLLGISWFWFFGAMFLAQLPGLGKGSLHGSEAVVTTLLAVFSVGVATGSLFCEKLSGGRVELGLVPLGSIGLSVFSLDLYFAANSFLAAGALTGPALSTAQFLQAPGALRVLGDIALLGLFGGFYIVPLYALVQTRSEKSEQSRVIAANNILNAGFMITSAGLGAGLVAAGASVPQMIAVCAILNAFVALYIYRLLPEFLWRFVAWLTIHTVYRVSVHGRQNVPQEGAALICPNHVSYADALIVSTLSPRPIRFVMEHSIFKTPLLGALFRAAKAIPICSARENAEVRDEAFRSINEALAAGELVCIFPEGRLSMTGGLGELKPGALKLALDNAVPIIPVGINGLQGSLLSKCPGHSGVRAWRRLMLRRVTVSAGVSMPIDDATTVEDLRAALSPLSSGI
jgi:1-acyl-sn-glycerol-3-phosphate acyltransferase